MSLGPIPFEFPAAALKGVAAEPIRIRKIATGLAAPRQFSLLIIDDNPDDLRVLRLALKWMRSSVSVSVNVAQDCQSTLNRLCDGEAPLPSVILLDNERQGKRCLGALERLKRSVRTRAIPVVIMARPGQKSIDESYAACANCVVAKPETVEQAEQLLTRLERFWFLAATLPPAGPVNSPVDAAAATRREFIR
jgi:CheY-like chemotaxis protein